MVPSADAIMEEDFQGEINNNNNGNMTSKVGGMFKRNNNLDNDDETNYDRLPLRKTATDYIYESVGGGASKQGMYMR